MTLQNKTETVIVESGFGLDSMIREIGREVLCLPAVLILRRRSEHERRKER